MTTSVFAIMDHGTPVYSRSTSCWANPLDLTGVSPWNSAGGVYGTGTAISRRHLAVARHFPLQVGATCRFVTSANTTVEKVVQGVASSPLASVDIAICSLDSDLPASIKSYKIFPPSVLSKWQSDSVPCFSFDQERKAIVKQIDTIEIFENTNFSNSTTYPLLTEEIVGGDSGNPVFTIINGEPILMTCWFLGGGGSGPAYHKYAAHIQSLMDSLVPGYTLETVDLSAF